jgi:hypothetical protein
MYKTSLTSIFDSIVYRIRIRRLPEGILCDRLIHLYSRKPAHKVSLGLGEVGDMVGESLEPKYPQEIYTNTIPIISLQLDGYANVAWR